MSPARRVARPLRMALFGGVLTAFPAMGQEPLSIIDWLGAQEAAQPAAPTKPDEPDVAKDATAPDVAVAPLGKSGTRLVGLVPRAVTGLPPDLWRGSAAPVLTRLIEGLKDPALPAAYALLYTVLLAEAQNPAGAEAQSDAFLQTRAAKLMALGALDPAQSLIEQAAALDAPGSFDLWMDISLLTGTEERPCATLQNAPHLTKDYARRIFCATRAGDWPSAALTFGTAQALDLLPPLRADLLARFLDPESGEAPQDLPPPRRMDPLTFRLFEAIGEPLPTGTLPRAYAVADLRDLAGWKAQLQAAERLARAGALPDNRLLGLYTRRKPAASGGVWDRAAALQRFETALGSGSAEAVAKTLPPVWAHMGQAGLEVSFAALFGKALAEIPLQGRAQMLSHKVQLLSPGYEAAARAIRPQTLATGIAMGMAEGPRPEDPMQAALYDAFSTAAPRADLVQMAQEHRLGEAILRSLSLLNKGVAGNATALRDALATLRALGLEDAARRAAIQLRVLER